jgi:hypothetical protein
MGPKKGFIPQTLFFAPGPLKRIHINRGAIDRNRTRGEAQPVVSIKAYGKTYPCHGVLVQGVELIVAGRPDFNGKVRKPLSCGARVYLETRAGLFARV